MGYTDADMATMKNRFAEKIQKAIYLLEKNYSQMDFKNAVEKDKIRSIKADMIRECSALQGKLETM
ncbi:MAG: hypothetical protein VB031_01885 [Eubacteriaceae bacterium]|nr:hypothetical protein [Eubacteriaceae bacterium]